MANQAEPSGRWARIREFFPLSNLGLLITAFGATAYWGFGLPRVDYVVQLVALFALVLVGLALLIVIPAAITLHRHLRELPAGHAIQFEAKRGYATLLQLRSLRWMPLVEISWDWSAPEGFSVGVEVQGQDYLEYVEALQRGQYEIIHRRFLIEDAFGLARIVLHRHEARTLTVLPWTGLMESSPMLRAHASGDELSHPAGEKVGDRIDIRRYEPGDPLKWVLWKIFARTGQMMVRTPERSISPSVRILAYLPTAAHDEPAAAAARVAVSSGIFSAQWRFRADGSSYTATDPDTALKQIVSSRCATPGTEDQGQGLAAFIDAEAETGRSRLLLFVPAQVGPWLENALEAIRKSGLPVTAIICTDGIEDVAARDEPRYANWIRRQDELSAIGHFTTNQAALTEVVERFASVGAEVIGIERPTGRTIHTATRYTLESIRRVA
jgi:hypothetical protein